jgi:phosphoribosylpyrophosphate synthetase
MRVEKAGIRAGQNKRARNSRLRIEEIQRMIVSKMSFEDEELLLQYEEAISAKDVIIYERIYWQGLKDGIRIANKSKDITRM